MISARCGLTGAVGLLAACSTAGDPCDGAATCVRLDVHGTFVETIDQLTLDVVYGSHHATTTAGTAGELVDLPVTTAIILDLPSSPTIEVDIIAAGKLRGALLGAGAASTTVQQGHQGSMLVLLGTATPCIEGALYCGGTETIFAEFGTLYRCTGGIPIFYAKCSFSCSSLGTANGVCAGRGLCRDGGTYCGGHALDGDPNVLYVCEEFDATAPRRCANGCVVRGDGDDVCR